jgi:RNA-directed DNA polymerase
MYTTKSFYISKQLVMEAFKKVKGNKGAAGVDAVSLEAFEVNLKDNLYKIWNRLSSGCYFPPPVKAVEIPKSGGGIRILGIPTVSDRIAQMVVKMTLEPTIEPYFHKDSYGYRPWKSALDAVETARQRCWRYAWVIDLDIKGFFDNLDHDLVMKAVEKHTKCKWVILYIKRWLKAPMQQEDGTLRERNMGTPQGGVISPLLANLFLHYAFDEWIRRKYPQNPFERYADDIIAHCKTYEEAVNLLEKIKLRLKECHLEVHPVKTKIVFCKDSRRNEEYEHIAFDFLGYTFRPRKVVARGRTFTGFNPAVSNKAKKKIHETIRKWRIHMATNKTLEDIAKGINPIVRGWINYYGRFYKSALSPVLCHLNDALTRWVKKKYKGMKGHHRKAKYWVGKVAKREPQLFCHWKIVKPLTEQ